MLYLSTKERRCTYPTTSCWAIKTSPALRQSLCSFSSLAGKLNSQVRLPTSAVGRAQSKICIHFIDRSTHLCISPFTCKSAAANTKIPFPQILLPYMVFTKHHCCHAHLSLLILVCVHINHLVNMNWKPRKAEKLLSSSKINVNYKGDDYFLLEDFRKEHTHIWLLQQLVLMAIVMRLSFWWG